MESLVRPQAAGGINSQPAVLPASSANVLWSGLPIRNNHQRNKANVDYLNSNLISL
jgi:hypothetical protein